MTLVDRPEPPWGARSQFLGFGGGVIAGRWCALACCRPVAVWMVWSFVYLTLRRVPEFGGAGWRSAEARKVEILVLVTSWPSCAASTPASAPDVRCLRSSAACCPGPDGRSAWSRPRCGLNGTAAWWAGAGPIQLRHAASHRSPAGANPDRAAGHREPTLGRPASAGSWALAARSPPGPSPGCLRANGLPRGATLASLAPADPAVPQMHWSRRGQAWSARPGCHWPTSGRIRRFLGQAVTDGLLL
jgi:hypothetical protein